MGRAYLGGEEEVAADEIATGSESSDELGVAEDGHSEGRRSETADTGYDSVVASEEDGEELLPDVVATVDGGLRRIRIEGYATWSGEVSTRNPENQQQPTSQLGDSEETYCFFF